MRTRTPRRVAPLVALGLLVAACGDDDDAAVTTAASETTTADDGATTTSTPEPTTSTTEPAGTVVEVEVAGGEPVGGTQDVDVALGDEVTIRVSGDLADEVHVHGYDLYADVPGELTFSADIPGQFEVELHESGAVLAELTVQ